MTDKVPLRLSVNGIAYDIAVEPRRTLADALRKDCGLTGTHVGCEHGVCGACTVVADGDPVRSCLIFAVQAEGCTIRTIEGLASGPHTPDALVMAGPDPAICAPPRPATFHPLQSAFIEHHGLQCGFCTPGFLMLAAAILERDPNTPDEVLIDALSSNLCRCTGYQGIIDAVLTAARTLRTASIER